jgi:hypothetical protein
MAINDTQKVDFLWKKLGYGAAKTDINSIKNATNESIASPLLIRGDTVWTDASQIPTVKPTTSSAIVEIYDDNLGNTIECEEDTTASPSRTWKTNLIDWIPSEFGSTYQIKVYIDNAGAANPQTTGTQVFAAGSGNNDEWFFDYKAGVLNFIGNNLPANISGKKIYIVGARYIGNLGSNYSSLNLGNFHIYDNTIEVINTNGDINLVPDGTGRLIVAGDTKIDSTGALTIPVGSTLDRPTPLEQGMIRYNTDDSTFEGYDGTNWGSLGGVKDVDQDTYIIAETSAGADNDQLDFYTGGTQSLQLNSNGDLLFGDSLNKVTIEWATGNFYTAGAVEITGDLTVHGTTTSINSNVVTIDDKNIELANGSATCLTSDGAGLSVDLGADGYATFTYDGPNDRWTMNKNLATNLIGQASDISNHNQYIRDLFCVTGAGTYNCITGEIFVEGGVTSVNGFIGDVFLETDDIDEGVCNLYYTDGRVCSLLNGIIDIANCQVLAAGNENEVQLNCGGWLGTNTDFYYDDDTIYGTNLGLHQDEDVYISTLSGNLYIDTMCDTVVCRTLTVEGVTTLKCVYGQPIPALSNKYLISYNNTSCVWEAVENNYVTQEEAIAFAIAFAG